MKIIYSIDKMKKKKGWSDYKLTKAAGLSPNTLSNLRLPGANTTIKTLGMLCKALDCKITDLIDFKF